MDTTADQALLEATTAMADDPFAVDADAASPFDVGVGGGGNESDAANAKPGVSLLSRGALRTFTLRHTWRPRPSSAPGLSASLGLRYDPGLQRRGGGLLRQLPGNLPFLTKGSAPPADGFVPTAALVWRSADGLARLSVSDDEAAAKQGWRFSAGQLTGIVAAELKFPLLGSPAARRDPLSGAPLPDGAPEPPRLFFPGAPADTQQRRAPKVSLSLDDVKPLWAYAALVGGAVLLGAPVSLNGKDVSIGLPGGRAGLPRRLAACARGNVKHKGWLCYALEVDELGGGLEIGPLLKLGQKAK
jgi:hypothetical protein